MSSDYKAEGFLRFFEPATPEKLKEVARNELGETETLKEESLLKLKTLIEAHGLACIHRDDFLLRFLRYKKFCVEKSFEALRNYARMRVSIHEDLLKLKPEVVKMCFDLKILGFLPYRDREERNIIFYRSGFWNPGICSAGEISLIFVLLFHYAAEDESFQVLGKVSIWDSKNGRLSALAYLFPLLPFLKNYMLQCLPGRYPMFHCINPNKFLGLLFPVLFPLLPKKIRERIQVHGSIEKLHEHISTSILPDEFGGSLGPLSNDHLTEAMMDYLQKMKDEQQ